MKILLLAIYFYLTATGFALQLDLHAKKRRFTRRDGDFVYLSNHADVSYYADITIGGNQYSLLVDTGSSDLWVAEPVSNSSLTDYSTTINYAVGSVTGLIKKTSVDFAGHTISDQVFLEASTADSKGIVEGDGIIGLGPNNGSHIYQMIGNDTGAALLDRVFLQNTTTPNFITILLGRIHDPNGLKSGRLTIGEVLGDFKNITEQPKLPVIDVDPTQHDDQHFQILLDEDGLIGPDGQAINMTSRVSASTNPQQLTAVVDTGFSLPQLPSYAVAAIYQRFHGAEQRDIPHIGPVWTVPCTQEVNITFKFAGVRYPIHPLDTTLDPETLGIPKITNAAGKKACIGTFQPFSYDTGHDPNYDMVLGMAFLRNIYLLMDYGDFVMVSNRTSDPYMQFLSTTDPAEAHAEFVKIRLNGVDTTGDGGLLNNSTQPSGGSNRAIGLAIGLTTSLLILVCFLGYKLRRCGAIAQRTPVEDYRP